MCSFEGIIILDSSMVEHTAVNRGVVGSSPTRGVKELKFLNHRLYVCGFFILKNSKSIYVEIYIAD